MVDPFNHSTCIELVSAERVVLGRSAAWIRRVRAVGRHEFALDLDTEIKHSVGDATQHLVLATPGRSAASCP